MKNSISIILLLCIVVMASFNLQLAYGAEMNIWPPPRCWPANEEPCPPATK